MAGQATENAQEFLSGKLSQVDCERIERELRDIWQSAQDSEYAHKEALSRACVASLIVYAQSDDAEVLVSPVLDELAVEHPLRAILAVDHADADLSHIEAWVSARCHPAGAGGNKHICCEQVTIKKHGPDPGQLPSVVLPLLVPDLPVYLWWYAPAITGELIEPFLAATDRLIVDSSKWAGLHPFKLLADLQAGGGKIPYLSDLSWQRLRLWRAALSSSWPALTGLGGGYPARTIGRVAITAKGTSQVQQALLTAWLAARLDWRKVSADLQVGEFVFSGDGNDRITVNWLQKDTDGEMPPGTLGRIDLSFKTGKSASLAMHEKESGQIVVLHADDLDQSEPVLSRGDCLGLSGLVSSELSETGCDHVFEETLAKLSQIDELFR